MKMSINKFFVSICFCLLAMLLACNTGSKSESLASDAGIHTVTVKEVMHVTAYTYLFVTEDKTELWLAVPKMEAQVGDVLYYDKGMLMTNFPSKDLNKTFEEIIFVEKISNNPDALAAEGSRPADANHVADAASTNVPANSGPMPKPVIEQVEVGIEPLPEGPSIAQLYDNRNQYSDKLVKLRGQVTKVNNGIMGTNWVHIQDGTQSGENIDLTVTTAASLNVGDIIVIEGRINLNMDFGYGYSYEVIMTEGTHITD